MQIVICLIFLAIAPTPFWENPVATNWALVVVGAVAAGAAIWTLRVLVRQTKAVELAAKAAKQSADATEIAAEAAHQSSQIALANLRALRKTARREMRARVFVNSAVRKGSVAAGIFDVEVTIRNFGKVPAYDCTYALELVLKTNPPNSEFTPPSKTGQEPKMILPPGAEVKVVKTLPAGAFGNIQHTQVGQGSQAIYLYGEIHYRDGFRRDRFSTFRLQCSGVDYGLGRFSFCDRGNQAN